MRHRLGIKTARWPQGAEIAIGRVLFQFLFKAGYGGDRTSGDTKLRNIMLVIMGVPVTMQPRAHRNLGEASDRTGQSRELWVKTKSTPPRTLKIHAETLRVRSEHVAVKDTAVDTIQPLSN